jgi:hypothetical protein
LRILIRILIYYNRREVMKKKNSRIIQIHSQNYSNHFVRLQKIMSNNQILKVEAK